MQQTQKVTTPLKVKKTLKVKNTLNTGPACVRARRRIPRTLPMLSYETRKMIKNFPVYREHGKTYNYYSKEKVTNFVDETGKIINPANHSIVEQYLTYKWIAPNDIVLELGGGIGIVSYTINSILDKDKKDQHVVVEPDKSVITTLKKNKRMFNARFKIHENPISSVPLKINKDTNHTYFEKTDTHKGSQHTKPESFFKKYPQKFNVLVAYCEGCLDKFITDNEQFLHQLNMVIFKHDNNTNCDYKYVIDKLKSNAFKLVESLYMAPQVNNKNKIQPDHQVWVRKRNGK